MPVNRENIIRHLFELGLEYKDILRALAQRYQIILSLRHLKRILKKTGLTRRNNYSNVADVIDFIQDQLTNSGKLHGYRWMHVKCKRSGLKCRKEDVRLILSILDPEGTLRRRRRRLLRRVYNGVGPNNIWHFDSYDKIKRYGICINGCVDGFSRKVIWLNVYVNSSDPKIIGGYFMESVEALGGCPRIIRGDHGTENTYVRDIQRFLRRNGVDPVAGERSYMSGASTANQRIEYWWSFLRRECMDFWIEEFHNMLEAGQFDGGFVDINLLRYCFLHIIQDELDSVKDVWNDHIIRPSRNTRGPSGRPNVMYSLPDLYQTRNFLFDVPQNEIVLCKEECILRSNVPCDQDVYEMCNILLDRNGYIYPSDLGTGKTLYLNLRRDFRAIIV